VTKVSKTEGREEEGVRLSYEPVLPVSPRVRDDT
jgi:hypothetical protein